MITKISQTSNYNNNNMSFKAGGKEKKIATSIKEKFVGYMRGKMASVVPPKQIVIDPYKGSNAELSSLSIRRNSIINAAVGGFITPNKSAIEYAAKMIRKLTIPEQLREAIRKCGYGEKFEELRKKHSNTINPLERMAVREEIRALIDDCAKNNPEFDTMLKTLKTQYDGINKNFADNKTYLKVDYLDAFMRP